MTLWLRALVLFLTFSVEIRVKAQDLQNLSAKIHHERHDGIDLQLEPGAAVSKLKGAVRLVIGIIWAESKGPLRMVSAFGEALCERDCGAVFERGSDHMKIHAIKGEWGVYGLKADDAVRVQPSSSIDLMNVAEGPQLEFPYTLSKSAFERLLDRYLHLTGPDKEKFRKVWEARVEEVSGLYQDRASRQIASFEDRLRRQAAARKREAEELKKIREEFRRRNDFELD